MDYPQDLINRAYLLAHRLGSPGERSRVELVERISREDIPLDLAERAADDVLQDVIAGKQKAGRTLMSYGLMIFALGLVLMIASYLLVKILIFIPIGFIFVGIAVSWAGYSRSKRRTL